MKRTLYISMVLLLGACAPSVQKPVPVPTDQTPPVVAAPDVPDPAITSARARLIITEQQGSVLIQSGDVADPTIVRLGGCPGWCRLTGEGGIPVPAAGLAFSTLPGLFLQVYSSGAFVTVKTF